MTNQIKKIVIIILTVLLLVFVVILSMQLFNFEEEKAILEESPIIEEEAEAEVDYTATKEFLSDKLIKATEIASEEKERSGSFLNLYNIEEFTKKMQAIKSFSPDILIYTNISEDGLHYCAVAVYGNENYLCIDDSSVNVVFETENCMETTSCVSQTEEDVIVEEEPIAEEEPVIEEGPLIIDGASVIIGNTTINERYIGEDKYIVIDGEELGPYYDMYFNYDDTTYGILCNYYGVWYININGDVSKVSELNEENIDVNEFFILDGRYVFIFSRDGYYYVSDNSEILGPFDEYPNLFE